MTPVGGGSKGKRVSKPNVQLRKNAVNIEHIHAFWQRETEVRNWQGYIRNQIQYLRETGREPDISERGTLDKPVSAHPYYMMGEQARHEDGDQTIFSNPPKWWQKGDNNE